MGLPPKQGLYDPQFEHDSCGVGMVVDIKGRKSHRIIEQAVTVLAKSDSSWSIWHGSEYGRWRWNHHTVAARVFAEKKPSVTTLACPDQDNMGSV